MKSILNILCLIAALTFVGCSQINSTNYVPSIASLEPNETLIMKFRECHSGCTKGKVRFKNKGAILGGQNIILTDKEIADLDTYFSLGEKTENLTFFCSSTIKINFKQKKLLQTVNSQSTRVFPCSFDDKGTITPYILVDHLTRTPFETPYWRLSESEQEQISVFME